MSRFEANKILETATAKNARFYWTRNFAKNQKPWFARLKMPICDELNFAKHPKDLTKQTPNGLRYLRWGRDGEAVQPEKG